jgi:hypothetical protein
MIRALFLFIFLLLLAGIAEAQTVPVGESVSFALKPATVALINKKAKPVRSRFKDPWYWLSHAAKKAGEIWDDHETAEGIKRGATEAYFRTEGRYNRKVFWGVVAISDGAFELLEWRYPRSRKLVIVGKFSAGGAHAIAANHNRGVCRPFCR